MAKEGNKIGRNDGEAKQEETQMCLVNKASKKREASKGNKKQKECTENGVSRRE